MIESRLTVRTQSTERGWPRPVCRTLTNRFDWSTISSRFGQRGQLAGRFVEAYSKDAMKLIGRRSRIGSGNASNVQDAF